MPPLVTIITPTYNHELYIRDCIESIRNQDYQSWEQVIIDDDSTDDTWPIICQYAKLDSRIRVFKQEHEGIWNLKKAYNRALAESRGLFIAILEGDDYWFPDTLNVLVNELMHLPDSYGMVYGKSITVGRNPVQIIGKNFLNSHEYEFPCQFSHQIYTPSASIPPQSSLIKKDALLAIGGFYQPPSLPLVDRPTFLELSLHYRIHHVNRVLSYWRQHQTNITSIYALEMASGAIPWVESFFKEHGHLPYLRIQRSRALRTHQSLIFRLAVSMMSDQLKEPNKEDRRLNLEEIYSKSRRSVRLKQKVLMQLNMACVSVGIDIRPEFYFLKNLLTR